MVPLLSCTAMQKKSQQNHQGGMDQPGGEASVRDLHYKTSQPTWCAWQASSRSFFAVTACMHQQVKNVVTGRAATVFVFCGAPQVAAAVHHRVAPPLGRCATETFPEQVFSRVVIP